jgi:UDP-3-O-[3-hydroxymyristoyl] glucosamine N-acyltransferase
MSSSWSLQQIVERLGGTFSDKPETPIVRVGSLAQAQAGAISFFSNTKYTNQLNNTSASAVIIGLQHASLTDLPKIITDNPYAYFAKVSQLLNPIYVVAKGVDASAVINSTASVPASCSVGANVVIETNVNLGNNVTIGAGCVIERNSSIGDNSVLEANVTIKHGTQIGKNCHIFSGAVIGSDGFGYAQEAGVWLKIPQVGRVVIHHNVDVGANTTIDRGALDDTIIEDGVKLDNLIQIGHNCIIGSHTVIAACTAVAGSTKIGSRCKIGGAAMIHGHIEITDDVTISPGSLITKSLLAVDTYTAIMPFQTHKAWLNTAVKIRNLDTMADKIKHLEKELALLKSSL